MNKVGLKNNFSLLLKEEAKWLTAYHNNKQFGNHFFAVWSLLTKVPERKPLRLYLSG